MGLERNLMTIKITHILPIAWDVHHVIQTTQFIIEIANIGLLCMSHDLWQFDFPCIYANGDTSFGQTIYISHISK